MREFWVGDTLERSFSLFGLSHIIITLLTLLIITIVFISKDKIRKISVEKFKKWQYLMALILFLNMAVYYGTKLYYGVWDWRVHLPLHFCFITGNIFIIYLLTNNKRIQEIIYFWVFVGAIPAIIWPDLLYSYNHFIFYQFIISHHILLIFNIIMLIRNNSVFTGRSIIKTFGYANLLFLLMSIFNSIFNTNYIMSDHLPQYMIDLYPFLGYINYPFILLELSALIAILLAYGIVILERHTKRLNA